MAEQGTMTENIMKLHTVPMQSTTTATGEDFCQGKRNKMLTELSPRGAKES